jgi:hypothetical protein
MTLNQKINDALFYIEPKVSINKCEQIAEEFAIGFAEWCDDNYFRMGNTSFWAESMDWDNDNKFTTKELLEIYKETL